MTTVCVQPSVVGRRACSLISFAQDCNPSVPPEASKQAFRTQRTWNEKINEPMLCSLPVCVAYRVQRASAYLPARRVLCHNYACEQRRLSKRRRPTFRRGPWTGPISDRQRRDGASRFVIGSTFAQGRPLPHCVRRQSRNRSRTSRKRKIRTARRV